MTEDHKSPRKKKDDKYIALPRNKRTERALARIFQYGTEQELMQYMRENDLKDDDPRFVQIVKLFHEHGGKRL